MGFIFTILGTMLVVALTWQTRSLLVRLFVTVISAYAAASLSYWVPFLFNPDDQATIWQWLVINAYFKAGVIFGMFLQGIIQIVKTVGVRNSDN